MKRKLAVPAYCTFVLVSITISKGAIHDNSGGFPKLFQYIEESEYEIRWQPHVGAYQAPNRANNLRFTYSNDAVTIEPREFGEDEPKPWEFSVRLLSVGKGKQGLRFAPGEFATAGRTAVVRSPDMAIDYVNDSKGLRQSFQILSKPAGDDPLTLIFHVSGDLAAIQMNEEGTGIEFVNSAADRAISYSDLHVWDATERKLHASMALLDGGRFAIVVDDSEAVYPILVDPIYGDGWSETNATARFGYVVLLRGIYADQRVPEMLIGAPQYDTGSADAGSVFYFTHANDLFSANVHAQMYRGGQSNAKFGSSISVADIDGDGYQDLIVGAPYYNGGGMTDNGKVFVYSGGGTGGYEFDTNSFWSATGFNSSDLFGYSVLGFPDVNNDFMDEVIVGAPGYSYVHTDNGAVFGYFGGSPPNTTQDWSIYGYNSSSEFGSSLAYAGDVNLDAYHDLLIGAPSASQSGTVKGAAYLVKGTGTTLAGSATTIWGPAAGAKFGYSVAGNFDQNNDGYSDVLIGAPNAGTSSEGKAYVHLGDGTTISSSAAWSVESNQSNGNLGHSVATGDIDRDGRFDDWIIGLPNYDTTSFSLTDNGEAWFYFTDDLGVISGPNQSTGTGNRVLGTANYDHNGSSVSIGLVKRVSTQEFYHGFAVGAPDATSNGAGTVTIWRFEP